MLEIRYGFKVLQNLGTGSTLYQQAPLRDPSRVKPSALSYLPILPHFCKFTAKICLQIF